MGVKPDQYSKTRKHAALLPTEANAATSSVAGCTAQTPTDTSFRDIIEKSIAKNCSNSRWSITGPRVWLFFDKSELPQEQDGLKLRTDLNRFTDITIYAKNENGDTASNHWKAEEAVKNWRTGSVMDLNLPHINGEITELAVAIDHPWMNSMMTKAVITNDDGANSQFTNVLFVICVFIGLALAPLIYNLAFYRVLRKPFLICHLGMTFFCLAYCILSSSLAYHFLADPPFYLLTILTPFAFSGAVSFASLFAANFIEEDNLSPGIRKMLTIAPLWIMGMMVITNIDTEWMRPYASQIYYLSFAPVLILFIAAIAQAIGRNSRAARFQLAAWTPIILVSFERLGRGLALYTAPHWFDHLLYAATTFEIIFTSLGVADRFVTIKRQLDTARAQTKILKQLADTDHLTGLINRRGIEREFNKRRDNITALALVDLDNFKAVNDQYGHDKGDLVLQAVSTALASSKSTIAGRIGGEEFILLIQTPHAVQEAESLRRAISQHVAHQIEGLHSPVTASCGVLCLDPGSKSSNFTKIYSDADKLLYQAKENGRNQIIADHMPSIQPVRSHRKPQKSAA